MKTTCISRLLLQTFLCHSPCNTKLAMAVVNNNEEDRTSHETEFVVGSVIRAPRRSTSLKGKKQMFGRAMIATIQDDRLNLLWEPLPPKPIQPDIPFLITPIVLKESEPEELDLERCHAQPLLPFEGQHHDDGNDIHRIDTWKDRGDRLFRLGDPSSAIPYYEMSLHLSSQMTIGSTIILLQKGFAKLAEVDCLDDSTIDVVVVDSSEDLTIPKTSALITVLEKDSDKFQERILLNLTRCLLQQSDIDMPNRSKYLTAAVLATTLVISIAAFHNDRNNDVLTDNAQNALVLRVKAQCGLSKWPNAAADAKRLIKVGNDQGRKLLENVESLKLQQQKKDKKLVKAMSRLIQSATTSPSSASLVSEETNNPDAAFPSSTSTQSPKSPLPLTPSSERDLETQHSPSLLSSLRPLSAIILIVVAAVLMQLLFHR